MADETNIVSQNQSPVSTPEPPVSVETQVTNTNTSAGTENAAESQQTSNSGNEQNLGSFAEGDGSGSYRLVQKEDGKRVLEFVPKEKPVEETADGGEQVEEVPAETENNEQQQTVTETAEQIDEELSAAPEPYSMEELTAAIASGNIDDRRVPEEHKQQVAQIRIQQAVQQYNQQQEAMRQAQQRQLEQQQLTPEQQAAQMREFMANVEKAAAERAAQDAGLKPEEIDNIDLLDDDDERKLNFKALKEWRRSEIMNTLQQKYNQENVARQQQAAIYKSITDFTAEQKAKEPNFDAINKMMETRIDELSHKKAKEIEPVIEALRNGTITEAQTVKLREYYEDTRKAYYAKKNNLSTKPKVVPKPPVVEKPGAGVEVKQTYQPDYNALRKASGRERIVWMRDFLLNQQ